MSVEIAHVLRGNKVESIHRGDIIAIDSKNFLEVCCKAISSITFNRSRRT